MSKQHAKIIKELQETGFIAYSKLTKANESYLQSLLETGILSKRRKGRGLAVFVDDLATLEIFIQKQFPGGLEFNKNDDISRGAAISFWRDSKLGKLRSEPVLINAKNNQLLQRNSEVLAVGELTKFTGVASFLLDDKPENFWQFSGTIALVENFEVFVNWQKTEIPADIAISTAGRISHRFIKWLKSSQMKESRIIHCGDYDPVGLDEFRRLYEQLGNKVSLYLPTDIDSLFRKYSKPSLLQKKSSANLLRRLRSRSHPDIIDIIKLIDNYNGGLEQEILLR